MSTWCSIASYSYTPCIWRQDAVAALIHSLEVDRVKISVGHSLEIDGLSQVCTQPTFGAPQGLRTTPLATSLTR